MAFIGNDYERGLKLLKDYAEDGEVHSKLNFIGEQHYPGCHYIGIKRTSSMKEMPKLMQADFGKLMEYASNQGGARMQDSFAMYHKWQFVKGICTYTSGIPMEKMPENLLEEFMSGEIPKTKIYTLEHVGPYKHLGNAWSTMSNVVRGKEINVRKNVHPFETYMNDPSTTDPHELIIHINFAVKS